MANLKRLTLASAFLVVVFSTANAVPTEVIDQICNKYTDKVFCIKMVGNEPRASAAPDLHAMDLLTITLAQQQLQDALTQNNAARNTMKDVTGKIRLDVCQATLKLADGKFATAWQAANRKSYDEAEQRVLEAKTDISICENVYKTNPVGVNPSGEMTQNAQKLADITRVVNAMARGH